MHPTIMLPCLLLVVRVTVGGQNKAWGVGKTDIWRGNGFAYAVVGGRLLCMYHKSEL
jgi:hypothetical protein